jgi:hypothetical protein
VREGKAFHSLSSLLEEIDRVQRGEFRSNPVDKNFLLIDRSWGMGELERKVELHQAFSAYFEVLSKPQPIG